jgi:hypothetical protein
MKKLLVASIVCTFVLAASAFAADSAQSTNAPAHSHSQVMIHKAKKAKTRKAKPSKKAVRKHKKKEAKKAMSEQPAAQDQGAMEAQPAQPAEGSAE